MRPARRPLLALLPLVALLGGCDLLGIETASQQAARREADGKAIGGACRHAARSIEQCFASNKRADRAAVFAGWREMNDYMRENNIEAVPAPPEPAPVAESEGGQDAAAEGGEGSAKPAKKGS